MGKKKNKLPRYSKPNTKNVTVRTDHGSGKKTNSKERTQSISSKDVENAIKPASRTYASRYGATKRSKVSQAIKSGDRTQSTSESKVIQFRERKKHSTVSKGSPKRPKKPHGKRESTTSNKGGDKGKPEEVKESSTGKKDDKGSSTDKTRKPDKTESGVSDDTEDSLLKVFESVNMTHKMWLELSRNNLGMFAKTQYEYNVFDEKKHRILTVIPAQTPGESVRASDKPKNYVARTSQATSICIIRYTVGSFFKWAVKIEVKMRDESVGEVQQIANSLVVSDVSGQEVMRVSGVPMLGCCKSGPDQFKSDVYLINGGKAMSVGVLGRNGPTMETTVQGEPGGFYFRHKKKSIADFRNIHKVYILAILVSLMTIYAD